MRKNVNLTVLNELVGTQYGDMTGLIQIDGHNNVSELFNLCREKGIDMDKYFLIGFGYYNSSTSGIGRNEDADCNVLLLEKEKYGSSFDEIKNNIKNIETVDVNKVHIKVKYSEFGKYIKRIDSMMFSELGNHLKNVNIIEEDIDDEY
ncbi:MAG: hypothetical protein ACFCUM_17710 [Bacteroidales bacterium]